MDFSFSDEQTQLGDSVKKFLAKEFGFEDRKKVIHSTTGESEQLWKGFVDLGLTALPIPEEFDGLSATPIDMFVVMQELGRGLVVGPYFATMWAAEIIKRAGTAEQKNILKDVAQGKVKLAVAFEERQSRYELSNVETKASPNGDGYVLNGAKSVVLAGGSADYFVVSARISGANADKDGLALFLVPKNAKGITVKSYRTVDSFRAAEITFDNVSVPKAQVLGVAGKAWPVIEDTSDYAIVLLCAEAIGVMESMCAQTTEYSKTRKQFGQPIGKFQVLQHRLVDMFMQLEQARSMAYLGVVKISSDDANERRRIISAMKVRVGQAAKFVAQQAVQTHGGMGMADELAISHYFRRLTAIELTLGDTDFHLARFMASK